MAEDDGPPLIRPIPRRPFSHAISFPTPPNKEEQESTPPTPNPNAQLDFRWLYLNPSTGLPTPDLSHSSLSRPASYMNLTSSTLFGIYRPASSASSARDGYPGEPNDGVPETPWGVGTQTPIRRPGVDEETYELMKDRAHLPRRRSSLRPADTSARPKPLPRTTALGVVARASLLFLLGVGYGILVTRFHSSSQRDRKFSPLTEDIVTPAWSWKFVAFWGFSGVFLGAILPLVDVVWEDMFGGGELQEETPSIAQGSESETEPDATTLWTSVMRAIGAFVGIVFAIVSLITAINRHRKSVLTCVASFTSANWHGHRLSRFH